MTAGARERERECVYLHVCVCVCVCVWVCGWLGVAHVCAGSARIADYAVVLLNEKPLQHVKGAAAYNI